MRAGAYLSIAVVALLSCTRILGIDGRYIEQEVNESGGVSNLGSGGTMDADIASGGARTSGGSGNGGTSGGGGLNGAGGIISNGGTTGGFGGGGGTVTGGAPNETGGIPNAGGAPVTDADVPCGSGEKRCPTVGCVKPDPSVGCELGTPCQPCDVSQHPTNSHPICASSQCDYECYPGFTRNQTTGECDAATSGSGGSAGSGGGVGSGGAGPLGSRCVKPTPLSRSAECRTCGLFPGCCNTFNRCGCLYVAACI
jgi:hypothetical protein